MEACWSKYPEWGVGRSILNHFCLSFGLHQNKVGSGLFYKRYRKAVYRSSGLLKEDCEIRGIYGALQGV